MVSRWSKLLLYSNSGQFLAHLTGSKALGSGEGRLWYRLMISLMLLVGSGLGDVGSGDSGSGVRMLGGSGSGFTV